MNPKVFIGSSAEGLPIAEVVVAHIAAAFEPRVWTKGLFLPGTYPLEVLEEAVHECMFAVIVGTADDALTKKGVTDQTIRDNLLFELGLFFGAQGRRRTILLVPDGVKLALPSDLYGLTLARYQPQDGPPTTKGWLDALQEATRDIVAAFGRELARYEASEAQRRARLLKERRWQAMLRLHRAVTQLRDLFIELPAKALAALGDRMRFESVKTEVSDRVHRMRQEWQEDANLLEVEGPLDELVLATRAAVDKFPYPAIYISKREAKEIGTRLLERGLRGRGLGALSDVADQINCEAERKAEEFASMYKDWWDRHSVTLRDNANNLQDALMGAALK